MISSFLADHWPSLYLAPYTLDLFRRCLWGDEDSPPATDVRCRWPDGPGGLVALAELVRGGMGLGGSKLPFELIVWAGARSWA